MTVSGEFRVDIRPYTGYTDPGLPIAAYIAQAGIAGDASGGDVFIDFLFQRTNDNQVSELFNLEQLSIDLQVNVSAQVEGRLSTLNMDALAVPRPASPQIWRVAVSQIAGGTIGALDTRGDTLLPIWLGTPSAFEGNSGVRFQWVNVDLRLYAITIQGYMWGPRSVLAEGGPRRPGGGLF